MRSITCGIVLCLALTATAWASVTGTISGTVKDNTDAVMPGVTVVATNEDTGTKHTAQTNAESVYAFLARPAATYRVDFQQTGFKDFRQVNIVLNANAVLRLDITMQLGGLTDVVEVSASAVDVEQSSTERG